MHIVQVSKASQFGGGASHVAEMLHQGLLGLDIASTHYARHPAPGSNTPKSLAWRNGPLLKAERALQRLERFAGVPYVLPTEYLTLSRLAKRHAVLFHFHDLSGGLSPLTLYALSRHAPVVWTLHDCSPLTGGCLYPMGCTRYLEHCGECPQHGIWPLDTQRDGTRLMRALQRWVHHHGRIHYVAPSQWLARLARGTCAIEPMSVIPNGVDISLFQPCADREQLRARLSLPAKRPLVLLTAGDLQDGRKGIGLARQTLQHLPANVRPFLLLTGRANDAQLKIFEGLEFRHFGYVEDMARLREIYAVADAYLNCTLADNFPLSVLESQACGTPVLGFRTGGLPEMVDDGAAGALVAQGDVNALGSVLQRYLRGEIGTDWRQRARALVVEKFSLKQQLQQHADLYRRLLGEGLR